MLRTPRHGPAPGAERADPSRKAREPTGNEEHDRDEERPQQEERLRERDAEDVREVLDPLLTREVAQPVVEQRVKEPADQRAEARPGASENDHDEQRERERRGRHLGSHADQQSQTNPPQAARNDARTNERACTGYGRSPITSTRRSFSRIAGQTCPADDPIATRAMTKTARRVDEREPVQVLRVDDADEEVGKRIEVRG